MNRVLYAAAYAGYCAVGTHFIDEFALLIGRLSCRGLDLDKYRFSVGYSHAGEIGKALRKSLDLADIDQYILLICLRIDDLALPKITGIGTEKNAVRRVCSDIVLNLMFRFYAIIPLSRAW